MMNSTNATVPDYFIPFYLDPLNIMLKFVGTFSSIVGLFGNFLVLILIFGSNKFRRPANFFVANLSWASITYILVTNFRFYAGRPDVFIVNEHRFLCLLLAFMGKVTHALIAFTTMAIVIDRNYRVNYPMSLTSRSGLLKIVFLIWFSAIVITLPRVFMYDIKTDGVNMDKKCLKTFLFNSEMCQIIFLVTYFILVTILPVAAAVYGLIQVSKVMALLSTCKQVLGPSNIRIRILRNTSIFSILFIGAWLPSSIVMNLTEVPERLMPAIILKNFKFFKYFNILGFVQNSLNPILLFVLSSDLRQYIYQTKERLCRRPSK